MISSEYIVEYVKKIVNDGAFDEDFFIFNINEAIHFLCNLLYLPMLVKQALIICESNKNEAQLPKDFHKNLFYAFNVSKKHDVKIFSSMLWLNKSLSVGDTGNVVGVATLGNNIVYRYIPSENQMLQILYYRIPTTLKAIGEYITEIPIGYGEQFLKYFLLYKCYEKIEDGVSGYKVNAEYYYKKMNETVVFLNAYTMPSTDLTIHETVDALEL